MTCSHASGYQYQASDPGSRGARTQVRGGPIMASVATARPVTGDATTSTSYERFAGICAILAGALTLLYSISFIILVNEPLSSFCLLANGLLATAVVVALYERVRSADGSFALWALLLGLAGGIGSALHGGYDLAAVLHEHAAVDP